MSTSKSKILLCCALIALSPALSFGGDWISSWSIELGMSSIYDDNILRYSDKYLTLFSDELNNGRFHVSTRDDLVLVSSIRGAATMRLVNSLPTTIAALLRQRMFLKNGIKDWSTYDLSVRQGLGRQFSAGAGYSYLPSFYVRHYRDPDWTARYGLAENSFQPFDYSRDEVEGWIQKTVFKETRVRLRGAYSRYFYNEHFTEYDCANRAFGVELGHPISKRIRLDLRYEFTRSLAEGDLNTDPSYEEDTYGVNASWALPDILGRDNSLRIRGEYARRCFTSAHPLDIDQLHAGRYDNEYNVSLAYECRPLKKFTFALSAAWQSRDARTNAASNADLLSTERNFRQFQIGLAVTYTIRHVATEESEFEETE